MTASQMQYEFEIGYELANLSSRSYTPKEISTLLTQAQNSLVLAVVDDDDSETKDILTKNLKVPYSGSTSLYEDLPNAVESDMPTNLLKLLQERVDITFNDTSLYYNINSTHTLNDVSVFTITEDYYNSNVENPDKQPYYKLVWRLLSPSTVILIGDSTYTPTTYKCVYIKRPSPIIIPWANYTTNDGKIDDEEWVDYIVNSLDCDLDESFHRKIIDRAIVLAIESTGNTQRLQTKVSIN
jgi:hypothetical protein